MPTREYKDIIVAAITGPCNSSKAGGNYPKDPVFINPLNIIPKVNNIKNGFFKASAVDTVKSKLLAPLKPFTSSSAPYSFKPL